MDAEQEIHNRIGEHGRITFAKFMEIALFWPTGGYYSRQHNIGPTGDFYTGPKAHPAFGALLSIQLLQMWQLLDRPSPFWVIEMGANDGLLARDIISYCAYLPPDFRDCIRYMCLDRSSRQGLDEEASYRELPSIQRVTASFAPLRNVIGCFLSNELMDSFPVHRVTMVDGHLQEVYVALQDGKLVEQVDAPSTPALEEQLSSVGVKLPEGFKAEVNLALPPCMDDVGAALAKGFVVTVDYGGHAEEIYSRQDGRSTLSCYYQHTQVNDPYQRIGRQDITAHVDFTSLVLQGRRRGLEALGYVAQAQFLKALGLSQLLRRLRIEGLGQREVDVNSMGMLDLVRPGGMGDFKVLVQGKNVGAPSLWGLQPSADAASILDHLPIPLRAAEHTPLLEGRYPHDSYEWGYNSTETDAS